VLLGYRRISHPTLPKGEPIINLPQAIILPSSDKGEPATARVAPNW